LRKTAYWLVASLAALALLALAACSLDSGQPGQFGGQGGEQTRQLDAPAYGGPGTWYPGSDMMGRGMMGSGMMGYGMMGGWGGYGAFEEPLSIEQAAESVRLYLGAYREQLELSEVMEFAWNFYAEVEERDTKIHAMELLIDKYTGQVYPEMGPNMMWNAKYAMMGSGYLGTPTTADMPVDPGEAAILAQEFLDRANSGLTVAGADTFYGYYTLHTLKGDQVEGMLSVNGYTGAGWYHDWHGLFVQMKEYHEET